MKIRKRFYLLLMIASIMTTTSLYGGPEKDEVVFTKLFNDWTQAFNHRSLSDTCDLFSHSVIADYQGVPQKNYAAICDGFKKIFQDRHLNYRYRFKLHHVYHSGNLAVVRMTWYLTIYDDKKLLSTTRDEGIDILMKNKQGKWKIINYIAYGVRKP